MIFVLLGVLLAVLIVQFLKVLFGFFKNGKISLALFFENGGFPSGHTAVTSALAFGLYLTDGFSSSFVVSIVLLCIVVMDALGVRRTVGDHSKLLNKNMGSKFDELVGHNLAEVIGGAFIGILISFIFNVFL